MSVDPKHSHPDLGASTIGEWEEHGHVGNTEVGQAFKRVYEADITERVDTATEGAVYIGEAVPGSAEDSEVWKIAKFIIGSEISMKWADGKPLYAHAWDDREALTYV